MKIITVIVNPNGEVHVAASGFKGSACEAATKAMEEALGTARIKKRTDEFYQTEVKRKQYAR